MNHRLAELMNRHRTLSIHGHSMSVPIIQGGMGVGVSLERLAGSVAAEGGMGCISTADCGYREKDFEQNPEGANLRALQEEIRTARQLSGGHGMLAVNAMVATCQYADAVQTAVKAGIDAVISGAGLPLELPALVEEGAALIAPIVSGGRAARLILKSWWQHSKRVPDFVVIEGPEAGGHLGFKEEQLVQGVCPPLGEILEQVAEEVRPYEEEIGREIPIFCAGGIRNRQDMMEVMEAGAAGVQMATRFIVTRECDASETYKEVMLHAGERGSQIIHSPVGMPGRALRTPLIERLEREGRIPPVRCSRCIKTCRPAKVPYCITRALIQAVKGNIEEGLFFAGAQAEELREMTTVHDLMTEMAG